MNVGSIDRRNDMRCIISLSEHTPLFQYSQRSDLSALASLSVDGEKRYLTYLFKREAQESKDEAILLSRFGADKRRNDYIVRERINNVGKLDIIQRILSTSTVISNFMSLSEGSFHVDFRFHSSIKKRISEIIAEYTEDVESTSVRYLGPSPGIVKMLSDFNRKEPLGLVRYSVPLDEANLELLKHIGEDFVAEVENKSSSDFRVLIYPNKPIDLKNVSEISRNPPMYEAYLKNSYLDAVRREANERTIFRIAMFFSARGDRIYVTNIMPESQTNYYMRAVFDVSRKMNADMVVENIMSLGETPANIEI